MTEGNYSFQERTHAWTSNIGPHWLSPDFCTWKGYKKLWVNTFQWLAG